MSTSPAPSPAEPDPAAGPAPDRGGPPPARRGPRPAAFDRLSALAARLVDAGHAKVTLFTDQDTVVGGFGLPPGVIGGPALLTGALSAIVVRSGAPLSVADARDGRAGRRPAGGDVGPGAGLPRLPARRGVRPRGRGAGRLRPRAAELDRRRDRTAPAAGRLRRRRAGALRRPVRGRHLGHPAERGAGGQLDRHLGTRPPDRASSTGTSAARRCSASTAPIQFESDAAMESRFVHPDDVGPRAGGHAAGDGGARPVHGRVPRADGRRDRALDGRPGPAGQRLPRRAGAAAGHDPRRHRDPRGRPRSGCRPCTGRRRSPRWPPSWPTPPGWRTCRRSCSAARRCSARSPARWPSSTPTTDRCGCT